MQNLHSNTLECGIEISGGGGGREVEKFSVGS